MRNTVFISHINEESNIANLLKETIEKKFLGICKVFASSNPTSIKLGDEWFEVIRKNLNDSTIILVLCSPISEKRPWINFEAGVGFSKKTHVVPLCLSGLKPNMLDYPLKVFQGMELNNRENMQNLFNLIAEKLEIEAPEVTQKDKFFKLISQYEKSIVNSISRSNAEHIGALLNNAVWEIKYSIIECTFDKYKSKENIELSQEAINNFKNYTFCFSSIHNLFNKSFLIYKLSFLNFEVFFEALNELVEGIKYINISKNAVIPSLEKLFNNLLENIYSINIWHQSIKRDSMSESLKNTVIKWIKENKEAPVPFNHANVFNTYISLYQCLNYISDWVKQYEKIIYSILA